MRAVTGTVTSTKPISISKAARLLSRFAVVDIGARRDVAAYLKRASNAFEDLVQFHRELRYSREQAEVQIKQGVEEDEADDAEEKKSTEKVDGSLRIETNENLTAVDRGHGERNSKERRKKKVTEESAEEERSEFERNNDVMKVKLEEEEDRLEERKRMKDEENKTKKKKKRDIEVVENKEGFEEEQRDRDGKWKRRHSTIEEGLAGGEDGSERREKKKKRRNS